MENNQQDQFLDAPFINEDCEDSLKNQWVLTASVQSLSGPSTVFIFGYQSMDMCIYLPLKSDIYEAIIKSYCNIRALDAQERQTYSVYFKITDRLLNMY